MKFTLILTLAGAAMLSGCASTYGNLVSGSALGAQEYQPAVYVIPGNDGVYQQVLGICRNAAVNRQITTAQEAQLKTLTGAVSGAAQGGSMGWQMGSTFKQAGFGTSINKSIGAGIGAGLLASLGSSFSSGANDSAAEIRETLLRCLRSADPGEQKYRVIE